MAEISYTEDDVGKPVVNEDGTEIGTVTAVRHGTLYVDPDPGVFDEMKAKLGWEDVDDDSYPLQNDEVSMVTDDKIQLRGF